MAVQSWVNVFTMYRKIGASGHQEAAAEMPQRFLAAATAVATTTAGYRLSSPRHQPATAYVAGGVIPTHLPTAASCFPAKTANSAAAPVAATTTTTAAAITTTTTTAITTTTTAVAVAVDRTRANLKRSNDHHAVSITTTTTSAITTTANTATTTTTTVVATSNTRRDQTRSSNDEEDDYVGGIVYGRTQVVAGRILGNEYSQDAGRRASKDDTNFKIYSSHRYNNAANSTVPAAASAVVVAGSGGNVVNRMGLLESNEARVTRFVRQQTNEIGVVDRRDDKVRQQQQQQQQDGYEGQTGSSLSGDSVRSDIGESSTYSSLSSPESQSQTSSHDGSNSVTMNGAVGGGACTSASSASSGAGGASGACVQQQQQQQQSMRTSTTRLAVANNNNNNENGANAQHNVVLTMNGNAVLAQQHQQQQQHSVTVPRGWKRIFANGVIIYISQSQSSRRDTQTMVHLVTNEKLSREGLSKGRISKVSSFMISSNNCSRRAALLYGAEDNRNIRRSSFL
ncbi:hypothetical protein M0804_002374 [Polistes exclamans]|nr:hypothetical protein M0804_002374 [Polistes exclamans]